MSEIVANATWTTTHRIEVPVGVNAAELAHAINVGEIPEWVSEEIDTRTAELTDWNAEDVG